MDAERSPNTPRPASAPTAAAEAATAGPPRRPPGRLVRRSLAALLALPLLAAALLGGLWQWTAREGSLAAALALMQRHLPEGMALDADGVTGTLRAGGHIDRLQWTQQGTPADGYAGGTLTVLVEDVDLRWRLAELLTRVARFDQAEARRIVVHDGRSELPDTPASPPFESLELPVAVHLPFAVGRLVLAGKPPEQSVDGAADLVVGGLTGTYAYDRSSHRIDIASAQVAQGRYRLDARIEGAAPMRTEISARGTIAGAAADAPTGRLQASAAAAGTLGGEGASLDVTAEVLPDGGEIDARATANGTPHLHLAARLHPWRPQPVGRADADWRQIDAGAFWPGAPRTRLDGTLTLSPDGAEQAARYEPAPGMLGWLGQTRWQAVLTMSNDASGPWDKGRLPVASLVVSAAYDRGTLAVRDLAAKLAGGSLTATGSYEPERGWLGQAELRGIDPGRMHGGLSGPPLGGRLQATSPAGESEAARAPVDFTVSLQALRAGRSHGIAIEQLEASGRWHRETLALPRLLVRLRDATLRGSAGYAAAGRIAKADLRFEAPGAEAVVQGEIGESSGQGTFDASVADAGRLAQWLGQWQGAAALGRQLVTGSAHLEGRWRGGWGGGGKALRLEAKLAAPTLSWRGAGTPQIEAVSAQDASFAVQGTLAAATLAGSAQIRQGAREATLALRGSAGRQAAGWQAKIEATRLQLAERWRGARWQADLAEPAEIELRQTARGLEARVGALRLDLGAPPGRESSGAHILAGPSRYAQQGEGFILQSRGQIVDVPLSWLDAAAGGRGMAGDLVLDGDWDLDIGSRLRLQASLRRSRGDLVVAAEGGQMPAGIRDARLDVGALGDRLQARLAWDSAAAGQAGATLATTLARAGSGWTLPANAALEGEIRLRLPSIRPWAAFAPPGWRLRGALQADARIAGTLQAPLVDGTLQADDLAVRSVVHGVAFSGGRLRTRFSGTRLDIDEFSLRGAPGEGTGGSLQTTGTASWEAAGGRTSLENLRLDLETRLQQLELSAMRERQIAVSGKLSTRLEAMRLTVRGALDVDHALIDLPADGPAALDSDVVIRPSRRAAAAPAPAAAAGADTAAPGDSPFVTDIDVRIGMGDGLHVRGRGLDARLGGTLTVRQGATPGGMPRLTGVIRTERGTFRAYGQNLDIESGRLQFTGAPDNPALDITAIRPDLETRVGVRILGTAQMPIVQLFSDPAMADAEKLSWLVLGRASSGAADAAVLQQAALALLAGNSRGIAGRMADALGLDDILVRGGSGDVAASSVRLGKRFSKNFYVAYERGMDATTGMVYFFYDISRRLKLRGQTGQTAAIDLIATWLYD